MTLYKATLAITGSLISIAVASQPALAQEQASSEAASDNGSLAIITVTANKREEAANDVPMSITALTGEDLANSGISSISDLGKLTPGFTFTKTHDNIPVLTIRGVGYYDNYIGATPTVSAYSDEVPMPYPILTGGALLDLERVEVLKGPQGTLFGQNATGGAINFVAAKSKDTFEGALSLGYGRFNAKEVTGYVTGPLSDTVSARLAVKWDGASAWQRSYTRDDRLGKVNKGAARLLLDYDNNENFSAELAVEGWYDKSESQASQLRGLQVSIPPLVHPDLATFTGTGLIQNYPNAPLTARDADWTPGLNYAYDNQYYRTSLRANYDISDNLTLTSITAYQEFDYQARSDADGTALTIADYPSTGDISAFYQELRLSGEVGAVRWVVGGNYSDSSVSWDSHTNFQDWSLPLNNIDIFTDQTERTLAGFANLEVELTDQLTLVGGARYTESKLRMQGCPSDSGDGLAAAALNELAGFPIYSPGQCYSLNDLVDPSDPAYFAPGPADLSLKEDNISWRVGANFKPVDDLLLYANVSRGYKSGAFTLAVFQTLSTALPATQEMILAYEVGAKYSTGILQLSGAAFYYDYDDKQILAPAETPPFGILDKLQNIPKSRVQGAEIQLTAAPIKGLRIGLNLTYLDSKVTSDFIAADPLGDEDNRINLNGLRFPYTADWQGGANISYEFSLSDNLDATLGAAYSFSDSRDGRFGGGPIYELNGYGLLDLRAAIETADGKYTFEIYGRNVTNEYYRINATSNVETIIASTGMPVTYGVKATTRF